MILSIRVRRNSRRVSGRAAVSKGEDYKKPQTPKTGGRGLCFPPRFAGGEGGGLGGGNYFEIWPPTFRGDAGGTARFRLFVRLPSGILFLLKLGFFRLRTAGDKRSQALESGTNTLVLGRIFVSARFRDSRDGAAAFLRGGGEPGGPACGVFISSCRGGGRSDKTQDSRGRISENRPGTFGELLRDFSRSSLVRGEVLRDGRASK